MGVSGRGGRDDRVSEQALSGFSSGGGSSSSLLRSPESSLTDDDGEVTSSARNGDGSFSSSSEAEDTMQVDGGRHAGGPLDELAAPLPVRAGLSRYYQGKSQSFTSLYNARCVEDLAKKTTPYITRMKLHRGHGVGTDQSSNFAPCSRAMQQDDSQEDAHVFV
ncbi:hypothetical protein ABZP36_021516 [Zizania latifolia]